MLITIPIGLWVFSLVADVIRMLGLGGAVWEDIALYTMIGGIVGALAAAIPGMIDFVSISDRRAKQIGLAHMFINLSVVAIYVVNAYHRATGVAEELGPYVLSVVAVVALAVSGWLGGELVFKHGVAVEPQHDSPEQERAKIRRAA
jgi:uncharacterized membrane protein